MKNKITDVQVNNILSIAANKCGEELFSAQKLLGGTQSLTYLVNNKFVVKINDKCILDDEEYFNSFYHDNSYTQKVLAYDNKLCFIVYKYIKGYTNNEVSDIHELNKTILNFTQHYKNYQVKRGFGGLKNPHSSWYGFLKHLVTDAKKVLKNHFSKSDFMVLQHALKVIKSHTFEKKLLHGDLRLNNLVFLNGKLTGIIDPYPIMGDYIFDYLLYLFSSVQIMETVSLNNLHTQLNEPQDKIKALMLITLFVKIKRMVKYSNQQTEVSAFMQLWHEIKNY